MGAEQPWTVLQGWGPGALGQGHVPAPLPAQPPLPAGTGLVPERAAPGAGKAGRLADPHARGPVRHPHPQLRPQRQLPPQAGRTGSHPSWGGGHLRGGVLQSQGDAGKGDG